MTPAEFKARLKLLQQTEQQQPVPPAPNPQAPAPRELKPQCPAEKIEDNGLVGLYCLEDEGHSGDHRFERSECS